jgi:DNA polymerase-3 subunit alpha
MTLLFLQGCCDLVGIKDIYNIPLDDIETFKGFVNGSTDSVFQFNSDVSINILGHLPLDKMNLDLLSMTTSAGRPGPMKNGQHIEFYRRANGERFNTPPHPALEAELSSTFGIMIYQENVMKASQILGGFTLAESDDIRKGMGKKDSKILIPYRERFINHCWLKYPETKLPHIGEDGQSHGTEAEYIWDLMATFSSYGFCKAHSMSYALIGYYCQYLKTHYPLQWWISCLKVVDADKLKEYYHAAKEYCVDPDINLSEMEYVINENKKIQFPFTAIKGLGPKATEEIYKCRPFTSFEYFISRVNKTRVNKTVVLRLIYSGCFESLHPNQKQELINKYFISRKEKVPVELSALTTYQLNENRITSLSFLSVDLYEIYGDRFSDKLTRYDEQIKAKTKVYVLGTIKKITIKKTKTDKEYGVIEITNSGESTKLRIWEDEINIYKESLLKEKKNIKFHCATSEYNNTVQMTILGMEEL